MFIHTSILTIVDELFNIDIKLIGVPKARKKTLFTHLSFEILQSITVFLLVFTMMNGKWMTELEGGGRFACCSA